METQKFNDERLIAYASYLLQNELKCEKFFDVNCEEEMVCEASNDDKELKPILFKPIMEIPLIFKGEWYYDSNYMPVWKDDPEQDTFSSLILYFGISDQIIGHLFSPGAQLPNVYGGREISPKSSHRVIAKNIIELIESVNFFRVHAMYKNQLN